MPVSPQGGHTALLLRAPDALLARQLGHLVHPEHFGCEGADEDHGPVPFASFHEPDEDGIAGERRGLPAPDAHGQTMEG